MKKFDSLISTMIDKVKDPKTSDTIKWKKVSIELFKSNDTPDMYRGIVLKNEKDWDSFIRCYSMNKLGVKSNWIGKELERLKPISEDNINIDDILNDALKEINEGKLCKS